MRSYGRACTHSCRTPLVVASAEAVAGRLLTREPRMRFACSLFVVLVGCSGPPPLTVDMPLHLEEHLDAATITGSGIPAKVPAVEWRFDQPRPEWNATPLWNPPYGAPVLARTGEGLRVSLTERSRVSSGQLRGPIHVDLPQSDRGDWEEVIIKARADSASPVDNVWLAFNLRDGRGTASGQQQPPFLFQGQRSPIVRDGAVHTYRLRVGAGAPGFRGPLRQLVIIFGTTGEPGSIELLSVSVMPVGAKYADSAQGVRAVAVGNRTRRTLFTHAPGRIAYRVRVPEQARLDVGLGVLTSKVPVRFAITASRGGDAVDTLLSELYGDPESWASRSADLTKFAGQTITLALETQSENSGSVALWGAPTVSARRISAKPNVIFYVIDGGGADQMSLYGYNRRTTPNLERLAAEGAVFQQAYSNSSWTKPSTASFMTSLHASVLGLIEDRDPVPEQAVTMAQRFHRAGYPTAVLTSNTNAGSVSALERDVDYFRDQGFGPRSGSSVELHREFWEWRAASPGDPFWVHFQTTEVHNPLEPPAPFAGLFASPGAPGLLARWDSTVDQWQRRNAVSIRTDKQFAEAGIDRKQYHDLVRSLYDEAMAHQDYQLGRFVERLKETGQWENTLLIIAADHSFALAGEDFVVPLSDSVPPGWRIWGYATGPIFRSSVSRVPLMFIWPGHIAGGVRFRQPVSMIDVLPTVLELAGLPALDVLQGQSLAPLLLGRGEWRSRPVIFDEFEKDQRTGELQGRIEMVDGRWGASLWIGPPPQDTTERRPTPLLLFDVWNDPLALAPLNNARPELVKKYTALLEKQWEAHQLLGKRFTPGAKVELTPEQLATLRALGYIR